MKQITVMILYSLLILIHVEPQIQGCYPDLNWTGYFSKRIDRLYGPGYLESRLNKGASIQPTGMRNNATVYLFGPKYIFEFKNLKTDVLGYQFIGGVPESVFVDGSRSDKLLVIEGGEWLIWRDYTIPFPEEYYIDSNLWAQYEEDLKLPEDKRKFDHHYEVGIVDDGISSISVWSELKETVKGKEVRYVAANMRNPFLLQTYDTYAIELNGRYPPWVEGDAGPGIGGKISVHFTRQVPSVYVLNGYVDLRRRDLYKANNRLKTVLLRSINPEFIVEYTFPDYVGFHEIKLPKPSQEIEIEIRSVYPGSRFDDTCISKIFAPQVQLRSDAEREADVQHSLNVYLGREDKR